LQHNNGTSALGTGVYCRFLNIPLTIKFTKSRFTGLETKVIVKKHEQNTRLTLTKSVCSTIRNAECVRAERPDSCCKILVINNEGSPLLFLLISSIHLMYGIRKCINKYQNV
ncbi:hypothetical protein P5673_025354, partial [Acropora cervicornis]